MNKMRNEQKYIITKKNGKVAHFKFPSSWHHLTFARDNGFDFFSEVLETGLLIDGKAVIIECRDKKHMTRRMAKTFLSEGYMKGRELESMLMYKSEEYVLREGD
jgi:hypothetical protein